MTGHCENLVVACLGPMTPSEVDDVRDRIRDSMNLAARVEINCGEVADPSICFIQILLAARKSAVRRGVGLIIRQPISASLRDALDRGGFIGPPGRPREGEEFWIGEP